MPCILPGHAENIRKYIDANLGFSTCFSQRVLVRAMHHDAGSRVRTQI